jgi:tetratricopeptide (TPR) repeat protein
MRDYEAVTTLTEHSGDRGGHVWSLTAYADTARMRGEMAVARKACAQALIEAPRLTDPQFLTFASFTCALVEMDGGEADKAAEMLRQVMALEPGGDGGVYHANAGLVLAQIDRESGRCPQAIERLAHVIGEFKAAELASGEADAEALRALCQQQVGNLRARDAAMARALQLRRTITSRQEVYFVDIVAAELGAIPGAPRDTVERLTALATDAEQRHWLTWSLEAKLAAWEYAVAHDDRAGAARLRAQLESSASAHGMGRILARLKPRSA